MQIPKNSSQDSPNHNADKPFLSIRGCERALRYHDRIPHSEIHKIGMSSRYQLLDRIARVSARISSLTGARPAQPVFGVWSLSAFRHSPPPMKSMTGYGWGDAVADGLKVTVELSSVNRKQSEISINLPRELEVLEAQIRDEVNRRIARGRVTARVTLHAGEKSTIKVRVNAALAQAYAARLRDLAKELKLSGDITLDHLLRAPGVMESDDDVPDAEDFWPTVEKALKQALEMMVSMREKEGAHLRVDLVKRVDRMRKSARGVQKRSPQVQVRYRKQLMERIQSAGIEAAKIEEERVLKEVIFYADRSDISEEITRLQSHFKQFDDCVNSREPVGRTLDFLAQEMNREINTIGSKANDAMISREVVVLKTELEKFREQAQNVE